MIKIIKEIYKDLKEHPEFIIIALIYQGLFLFIIKMIFDFVKSITINNLILVDKQIIFNYDIFYSFLSINGLITVFLILLVASLFLIKNFGIIFLLSDIYSNRNISFINIFKKSLKKLKLAVIVNIIKLLLLATVLVLPGFLIFILYKKLSTTLFFIISPFIAIIGICLFIYIYVRLIFLEPMLCLEKRKIKDLFNNNITKKYFWKLFKIIFVLIIGYIILYVSISGLLLIFKDLIITLLLNKSVFLSLFITLWVVLAATIVPIVGIICDCIFIKIITLSYFKYHKVKVPLFTNSVNISNKIKKLIKKYKFIFIIILIIYIVLNMSVVYPIVNNSVNNLDEDIQITAHRGYSSIAPENTLVAFSKAIDANADFIEFDVQQTKDRVIVVFHDKNLKRITSVNRNVSELNYSELKDLNINNSFSKDYKNQKILTLKQVIDLAKHKTKFIIEIKSFGYDNNIEENIVELIQKEDIIIDSIIISSDYNSLSKIRSLNPNIKIGLILGGFIGDYSNLDVDIYVISAPIVGTQHFMKNAQNKNKKIFVYPALNIWSLNPLNNASRFIDFGVDNLIVNDVNKTKLLINKMNNRSILEKINDKMICYFQ